MKRTLFTLLAALTLCVGMCAQTATRRQNSKESLTKRATRMADELKLDDAAQAWFVPIYAEYLDTLQTVNRQARITDANGKRKQQKELSDLEASQQLLNTFAAEEQAVALKRAYYERLKEKLTPQQLLTLFTRSDRPTMQRPQQGQMRPGGNFQRGGMEMGGFGD